jgi:hypothetical protein
MKHTDSGGWLANAQRAVDHMIKNIAALKEQPQLLLNAGNVATATSGCSSTSRPSTTIASRAWRHCSRRALDAAGLYQYHISVGTPAEAIVQYATSRTSTRS